MMVASAVDPTWQWTKESELKVREGIQLLKNVLALG